MRLKVNNKMVQDSNTLQESSMDELLASIRDIIEEGAKTATSNNSNKETKNEISLKKNDFNSTSDQSIQKKSSLEDLKESNSQKKNSFVDSEEFIDSSLDKINLHDSSKDIENVSHDKNDQSIHISSDLVKEKILDETNNSNKQKTNFEEKFSSENFSQEFCKDLEHSAELLLRPYISKWLDEHFKKLFERILCEEMQRFIQILKS